MARPATFTAPVVWLGFRDVHAARHPAPFKVWPVRIVAGAFGPGRPRRDLLLSRDHAVFFGEVLIPVKRLINRTTIAQMPTDAITYYHVQLPRHDVPLAEGLPVESYLDAGDRGNFANGGQPQHLHPDFSTRVWEADACASLVVTGAELDAARSWLAAIVMARPPLAA